MQQLPKEILTVIAGHLGPYIWKFFYVNRYFRQLCIDNIDAELVRFLRANDVNHPRYDYLMENMYKITRYMWVGNSLLLPNTTSVFISKLSVVDHGIFVRSGIFGKIGITMWALRSIYGDLIPYNLMVALIQNIPHMIKYHESHVVKRYLMILQTVMKSPKTPAIYKTDYVKFAVANIRDVEKVCYVHYSDHYAPKIIQGPKYALHEKFLAACTSEEN